MGIAIVRPAADAELGYHAQYLADRNLAVGKRLYNSAQDTFAILAELPGLGTMVPSQKSASRGLRYFGVSGLPMYLIFYREIPGGIEVVRFLHSSQDWEAALQE